MRNSWQFARSHVLRILVATCVIGALLGYSRKSSSIASAPRHDKQVTDPGPCPHYWSKFFKNHGQEPIPSLPGRQIDVPEYNDCQRLLVNKSGHLNPAYTDLKFGHEAVIFARADINKVYQTEAPIVNAVGRPFFAALKHPKPDTTRLTAIAQVWTTGTYAPLGLDSGFACIVLQWDGPVAWSHRRNYHAWMVPVANQILCASPLDLPASSAFYLGAKELPAQTNGDGPDEIPPVARWDWDRLRGEQYVGIACPSGWCELHGEDRHHPLAHSSSHNYKVPGGLNIHGKEGRVVRQKGWYDEQYLASTKPALGASPKLDGAGAFGTVFPVPI